MLVVADGGANVGQNRRYGNRMDFETTIQSDLGKVEEDGEEEKFFEVLEEKTMLLVGDSYCRIRPVFRLPLAGVACQINVNPETPAVLADNGRLKDILAEVITNAAEAAALGGGQAAVALDILAPGKVAEGRPGCVDIFVRNSGPAIPVEKLKDVFRPFHSTRDSRHYGIGLTIASVLLSQMGGTLGIRSDVEATTVWISLPAA